MRKYGRIETAEHNIENGKRYCFLLLWLDVDKWSFIHTWYNHSSIRLKVFANAIDGSDWVTSQNINMTMLAFGCLAYC